MTHQETIFDHDIDLIFDWKETPDAVIDSVNEMIAEHGLQFVPATECEGSDQYGYRMVRTDGQASPEEVRS